MSTIASITTKTYKATLDEFGACMVSGLHARAIVDERPDNGRALERRNALRREIQAALRKANPAANVGVILWDLA